MRVSGRVIRSLKCFLQDLLKVDLIIKFSFILLLQKYNFKKVMNYKKKYLNFLCSRQGIINGCSIVSLYSAILILCIK